MGSRQITILGLMGGIAGFAVGFASFRATSSRSSSPPVALASGQKAFYQENACGSSGTQALAARRFAEARRWFAKEVEYNPTYHFGYEGLARVASREGDHQEAYRQLSRAITVFVSERPYGNFLPFLYAERADASLALSRQEEAEATEHCRAAARDLVRARAAQNGDGPATPVIEETAVRLEQRLARIAARDGKHDEARAHISNAAKRAKELLLRGVPSDGYLRLLIDEIMHDVEQMGAEEASRE